MLSDSARDSVHKTKYRKFLLNKEFFFFSSEDGQSLKQIPKKNLWSLHPLRYSELNWTWLWTTCFSWLCLSRVFLEMSSSLNYSMILHWYCQWVLMIKSVCDIALIIIVLSRNKKIYIKQHKIYFFLSDVGVGFWNFNGKISSWCKGNLVWEFS